MLLTNVALNVLYLIQSIITSPILFLFDNDKTWCVPNPQFSQTKPGPKLFSPKFYWNGAKYLINFSTAFGFPGIIFLIRSPNTKDFVQLGYYTAFTAAAILFSSAYVTINDSITEICYYQTQIFKLRTFKYTGN